MMTDASAREHTQYTKKSENPNGKDLDHASSGQHRDHRINDPYSLANIFSVHFPSESDKILYNLKKLGATQP